MLMNLIPISKAEDGNEDITERSPRQKAVVSQFCDNNVPGVSIFVKLNLTLARCSQRTPHYRL